MFNFSPYGTKTSEEVLKIVENLKLKGYTLLKHKNSYGHSPYLENFFIWKKTDRKEYLRLILQSKGFNSEQVFYWTIQFSFKPSSYKHNHKDGNHWTSEAFKETAEDLYLSRFLEAIEEIKAYLNKSDRGSK